MPLRIPKFLVIKILYLINLYYFDYNIYKIQEKLSNSYFKIIPPEKRVAPSNQEPPKDKEAKSKKVIYKGKRTLIYPKKNNQNAKHDNLNAKNRKISSFSGIYNLLLDKQIKKLQKLMSYSIRIMSNPHIYNNHP